MRTPTGSTTRAAGGHDGEAVAPKGQGAKRRSESPSLPEIESAVDFHWPLLTKDVRRKVAQSLVCHTLEVRLLHSIKSLH
jgi:hypothetical protein